MALSFQYLVKYRSEFVNFDVKKVREKRKKERKDRLKDRQKERKKERKKEEKRKLNFFLIIMKSRFLFLFLSSLLCLTLSSNIDRINRTGKSKKTIQNVFLKFDKVLEAIFPPILLKSLMLKENQRITTN